MTTAGPLIRCILAPVRRSAFRAASIAVLALGLLWPGAALAQRDLKDIPDADPEIERQALKLADGFEINLFAADPQLAKPIQMSFDAQGRLWVASSETYPQVKPGQQADDKILLLEDSDGDGQADKTTVFARGLLIPSGIEPGDGGVYVANSTEVLFLKDSDGDGQVDSEHVLLSGFGTEDTHHILHGFRWGPDGRLYMIQSRYIHSHIETPWGIRRLDYSGIWRFRPDAAELEIFARGMYNPWGHAFDRWGQSFATDGAGVQGINYIFPGAMLVDTKGAGRILDGLNPGSPKECGLEIVDGRHLPDDWQGSLLTGDFRAHRVCRYVVSQDGAGFASRQQADLVNTTHVAFRPVDVKQGPDGAIYIADWYNPIIQHGEVDFRDPRRDHTHGRIWRVTSKQRPPLERPQLAEASTSELLAALKSSESWTRHFAKRVLSERGDEVLPELSDWVSRLDDREKDFEHHLVEGLWAHQGLNAVEPDLLDRLLRAKDPNARAAAVRVLGTWHEQLPDPLVPLATLVTDEHPRVRLEAICALARIGSPQAVQIALRALDKPRDRFLDHALYVAAHETQAAWLPALEQKQIDFGGQSSHLGFALAATESAAAVAPLAELIRSGKLPADQSSAAMTMLLALGGPAELTLVFDEAIKGNDNPPLRVDLLAGLVKAARNRKLRPEGDLGRLAALFTVDDENLRVAAAQAAGVWQVEALRPQLLALGTAGDTPEAVRQAALEGLAALGGSASREALTGLAGRDHPAAVRAAAIAALAGLDLKQAAQLTADLLTQPADGLDPGPLLVAFVGRKEGTALLAAAIQGKTIPADAAKLAVRAVRAAGLPAEDLLAALAVAGGLKASAVKLSPDEMRTWVQQVATGGDAARGEAVFRRGECFKCHAIAGAGGRVGPDLVSIGTSAPVDYLIESILDPNAKIKENYHSLIVATDDGRVLTGVKVRETENQLVLRDAEDRDLFIPTDSIDERKDGVSLMPAGLADTLTHGELIDLVRFMSELGKVGPYAVDKSRVVRRWQALSVTPEATPAVKHGDVALVLANGQLKWQSVYSTVAGSLPGADIPAFKLPNAQTRGLISFQLEVTTAGRIDLVLPAEGIQSVWLDGTLQSLGERLPLDLSTGTHRVLLVVDPNRLHELRVELADVADATIQVQIVGGK